MADVPHNPDPWNFHTKSPGSEHGQEEKKEADAVYEAHLGTLSGHDHCEYFRRVRKHFWVPLLLVQQCIQVEK